MLCCSQFIPALQVGLLFSYLAPLIFVLGMTLLKEGYDDFNRWVRDRDTNNEAYGLLTKNGIQPIKWMQLKVGMIIEVHANQV